MNSVSADVVIVGSGMGGATTVLALALRGVHVLVLERGERLPREPENWSPRAVFAERRYKPAEQWLDGDGRPFHPGVHYVVGGNTKVYGATLPAVPRTRLRGGRAARGNLARVAAKATGDEDLYRRVDSIVNVAAITGYTNGWIGGRAPEEYVERILRLGVPERELRDVLRDHLVELDCLHSSRWEDFYAHRLAALHELVIELLTTPV